MDYGFYIVHFCISMSAILNPFHILEVMTLLFVNVLIILEIHCLPES